MSGKLYHSLDLSRSTLHPFNDFTLPSGPLSPPSEGGSPDLARSAWANSSAIDSMKMSSPHNARHSPLQERNPQDPYLSAPSDPEEIDFQASAIRLTPVGSSPNHSSPPNDDHEASGPGPAIRTHTGWPSQGTDYVGISSCTSLSDPSGFLAPSDIDLGSGANWQSGTTAPSTQSAWSASMMANASQWVPPEQTVPSPSSVPGNATAPGELSAAQHSLASLQKPKLGGSDLAISTDHPSMDGLTSASTARGRSPILLTIETVSRGDSPERGAFAHQRRASRSSTHLSPGGPDEFSSDSEGDIAYDDHRSVSSLSVARTHNGNWIRSPATGRGGLEPSARGNEYVLSPNDLEIQRERSRKNQDISLWSADVSAASSEAGDGVPPTPPRRQIQASNRLRARSTGDRPLQQEDYFNLQFYTGGPAPGPGVLVHESESSEDDDASESSVETTSDSLPADANEAGRYDRSTPEVYSSLELTNSSQDFRLYPWQDPPRDAAPRTDAMQPGSSTAAMVAFEKRARDLETASLTATIDNNSIINFGANFERMRISGHPKSKERRSSSLLKRPFIQASNMLKRQASDLSLASTNTGAHHAAPEEPHRKESHRHRLSLSSKQHSRSPSLTNALISMSGQMAAIGGNNAVHAVSPNAEAIPKGFPTIVRGRSRSELPRPVTPGLMDLMTTHGGPPVAGIYRSSRPNTGAEQSRASVVPEPDTAGVEEEDLEMAGDKGLVMEFPPLSRPPVPTFEGFKAQIMQINPRLEPALIHRFAQEQVRRYKKLVDLQQKHSTAVANHNCKAGKFCFALGGAAALLDQRKASASSEAGQTQFRITDLSCGRDQPYVHGEGSIAAAQFPPGVPLPPVSHLPAQFECPICFQVKTCQKPSDWTKHVHEDLEPFTCSFPQCNEPKSFKRKADWVRHESERHRQHEWWTCAIPECSHTCFRKNNFLQHLVREHKMPEPNAKKTRSTVAATEGSSDSQRDREADRVERMMVECRHETQQTPSQEPCRFCGNICDSWKKLTVHLGKHMEQLALPVLELAKQSGASPNQAHLTPIPGSSADPNPSSLAGPFHSHHDAPNASLEGRQQYPTSNTSTPASHHFSYDMPMMNYPSISGTELSMEPDSITDGLQPGDQFPAYGMGQFDQATLHPLHQNSVTYPPPYNAVPRSRTSEANAPMLQHSYPLNSQLHPQDSSLYPAQGSYPGYQSVPSNSPYTTTMPGPYTSSYSSQM
ncbi:Zinc finger C2H2 [Penicillium hispanicum]|uniref:Zinc finger C2H2 n=1 Tax=Penicillium hispanicum TaxID=1080232 RepID=UPI00254084CC|nr:Zinc finger C2H2 [Penicillium hispanicum]KAJ5577827.1 Zinc finger C2H2 [Penicillium hispanicum]